MSVAKEYVDNNKNWLRNLQNDSDVIDDVSSDVIQNNL